MNLINFNQFHKIINKIYLSNPQINDKIFGQILSTKRYLKEDIMKEELDKTEEEKFM